jgi:hypothetical protein
MTDTQGVSPTPPDMQRSTRDLADIERRLRYWLENLLGEASQPEVAVSSAAGSNGMSSETILLDATWSDGASPSWHGWRRRNPTYRCSRATTCAASSTL